MYSWGNDVSAWKSPGAYKYDETPYLDKLAEDAKAKGTLDSRIYSQKLGPDMGLVDPKGKIIRSHSNNPIIFGVDGTMSMLNWPGEIFDRLPLFYKTLAQYREDVEVSFSVVGDAKFDDWPLQVADFGKGVVLDDYLKALYAEGRGGPGIEESYGLWAHFMNSHVETPNAEKPLLFLACDERFRETLDQSHIKKYLGDDSQSLFNADILSELNDKYDVTILRKEFGRGRDEAILERWYSVFEPSRIVSVPDATRVVDIAMGIVANRWGNNSDFLKNIAARQDSEVIDTVMASVRAASQYVPGAGSKLVEVDPLEPSKKSTKLI